MRTYESWSRLRMGRSRTPEATSLNVVVNVSVSTQRTVNKRRCSRSVRTKSESLFWLWRHLLTRRSVLRRRLNACGIKRCILDITTKHRRFSITCVLKRRTISLRRRTMHCKTKWDVSWPQVVDNQVPITIKLMQWIAMQLSATSQMTPSSNSSHSKHSSSLTRPVKSYRAYMSLQLDSLNIYSNSLASANSSPPMTNLPRTSRSILFHRAPHQLPAQLTMQTRSSRALAKSSCTYVSNCRPESKSATRWPKSTNAWSKRSRNCRWSARWLSKVAVACLLRGKDPCKVRVLISHSSRAAIPCNHRSRWVTVMGQQGPMPSSSDLNSSNSNLISIIIVASERQALQQDLTLGLDESTFSVLKWYMRSEYVWLCD